jgi:hypothetical protein
VFVAVDGARGVVEATIQRDTVGAGEAAMICGAHVSFGAANRGFAALQAACFACSELTASYALGQTWEQPGKSQWWS